MKRGTFLTVWILATGVLFLSSSYYYTCKMRGLCGDKGSTEFDHALKPLSKKEVGLPNFQILDRYKGVKYQFLGLPKHIKSDSKYRFTESYRGMTDSIYVHLNNDLNDEIVLRGAYVSDLQIEGVSDSLTTLDKLENLKLELIEEGVNPSKVVLELESREFLYTKSDTSYDALSMFFREISREKHVEIDDAIASKILYANYGSGHFIPDHKLEGYAAELLDYLIRYPEKNVSIIGYTDSKGSIETNLKLGKDRANNLKEFFERKGVATSRIKALSKGEEFPVASNDTDEGRALNRRIEVEIK